MFVLTHKIRPKNRETITIKNRLLVEKSTLDKSQKINKKLI